MSNKLPANFLKEIYEREHRYFTVYDKYTPNYHRPAVTPKFYSKYEGVDDSEFPEILKRINAVNDTLPRDKREWPETTSQDYGWFLQHARKIEKSDYRLYFPKNYTEVVKHGIKLLQCKGAKLR